MILIADSGSTKCDWLLIDTSGKRYGSFSTIGFNPYFHDANDVESELKGHPTIASEADSIKRVFFYGAGCSSPKLNRKIEDGLERVFKNARVYVDHDLIGAAYSTYDGSPAITAILGTGSNSCFFDGEKIYEEVPSLAYILGDESSGSYYGKRLLRDYFYKKLPLEMSEAFEHEYHLDKDELVRRVYNEPHANVYLASFMRFIGKFRDHAHVKAWLREGMTKFIDIHIQCYPQYKEVNTHFVGSVAYYFHDILEECCESMDVNMGRIIQKPIDGLVEYHLNYKMAELQF
jgi:N-acetylglucosamine kinase-like BadF-type ATPase